MCNAEFAAEPKHDIMIIDKLQEGNTVSTMRNLELENWVREMAEMMQPESVVWIDGSDSQRDALRELAVETGVYTRLNEEELPGCYLHRSAINDVARVEQRTFVCTRDEKDAGPNNNWVDPEEMYETLRGLYKGCMRGKAMYVIPFSMANPESPFARFGVELTDSLYVVLSMLIMTRAGKQVLDKLDKPGCTFTKALHATAELDPDNRYISHFPEDNTIWSINSAYGGNALLGKKCMALRIASYLGHAEGWLAEHMLILGIEAPDGTTQYICGAFPSACGKTNLAMLNLPESYIKKGYKVHCVGDDIAWMRIGDDGRLWAVNPESGFFGVAPGTSASTNPSAMETCNRNSIFTNVAYNTNDATVWWEGMDKNPPEGLLDWKGQPWSPESGTPAAHPNSRYTTPAEQCPVISPEFNSPRGVPISAIIFGGRRAKTVPLVYQSFDWKHGVFVGSTLASETTAASDASSGVRRDPMAMLPFCGYHMGDYFAHWLSMGARTDKLPLIFHVNWFRTDDDGHFLWPGFGENMRVIEWILGRVNGTAGAQESAIGYLPHPEDLNLDGISVPGDDIRELLTVNKEQWLGEAAQIREYFESLGDRLPKELAAELDALYERLA